MNTKKYIFASIILFIFIFIYEWIFHGMILKGVYESTSYLWRPQDQYIFPAMLGGQFMFPFIFSYIFMKGFENRGGAEGVRYGVLIGLLFIPQNLIMYAVQPLPLLLVFYWIIGGIIEMAIAGAILAAVYRP